VLGLGLGQGRCAGGWRAAGILETLRAMGPVRHVRTRCARGYVQPGSMSPSPAGLEPPPGRILRAVRARLPGRHSPFLGDPQTQT